MSAEKPRGYEPTDAKARPLLIFALALAVLIVVSMIITQRMDASFTRRSAERAEPHPMQAFRAGPQGPRLQTVPAAEMEEHVREEERLLSTYEWIDQENGVARIPIERAMEILSERGLPTREEGRTR